MPPSKTKSKNEIAANQVKTSDTPDIYANHIQVAISNNEMFLDFFYVKPSLEDATKPVITHVQRTVSPVAMAKGLASALANVIAKYEEDHNLTLPSSREPDPDDKVKIW